MPIEQRIEKRITDNVKTIFGDQLFQLLVLTARLAEVEAENKELKEKLSARADSDLPAEQ